MEAPLPEFIAHLYEKRFGKTRPDVVMTIEDRARAIATKEAARKVLKQKRRAERDAAAAATPSPDGIDDGPESKCSLDADSRTGSAVETAAHRVVGEAR